MFKVKVKQDHKQFKAGASCTVLYILNDHNSLPKLLIADEKGDMFWCEAEFFQYIDGEVKQALPVKAVDSPKNKGVRPPGAKNKPTKKD